MSETTNDTPTYNERCQLDIMLTLAGMPRVSDEAWASFDRATFKTTMDMLKSIVPTAPEETPPAAPAAPAAPAPAGHAPLRGKVELKEGLWATSDNRLFRVTTAKQGHTYATEWSHALGKFNFEQGVTTPDLLRYMREGKAEALTELDGHRLDATKSTQTVSAIIRNHYIACGSDWYRHASEPF